MTTEAGTNEDETPERREILVRLPVVRHARTTAGGITARWGSTLGRGTVVIEERDGDGVKDGPEEACFSSFALAVPHPAHVIVAWDGGAYALVSADRS
jgi:hypothetical protein